MLKNALGSPRTVTDTAEVAKLLAAIKKDTEGSSLLLHCLSDFDGAAVKNVTIEVGLDDVRITACKSVKPPAPGIRSCDLLDLRITYA